MLYNQSEADFNETAYGMYLTHELQGWFKLQDDLDGIALPPTLRDEADLGYDMAIPRKWGFLYLQFKMPDYLRRRNASEWRTFGQPYFRFKVKTDVTSNGRIQHNVLCDLEDEGEAVFYAAPAFLTSHELTYYALKDCIYANSAFPRPSDLGHVLPRSNHCFAYINCRDVRAFSEPGPSVSRGFYELTRRVRGVVEESEPIVLDQFLSRSAVRLVEVVGASSRSDVGPLQSVLLASSSVGLMPILVSAE